MRACARPMTQRAVANRLLYLRDSEGGWGQGAGMPQTLRERRMRASRRTGGQPSNRIMQGTGLQLSSITDSSCVQLLQQEQSKIWSAQDSVLAGFTPFLPWSLNILLCNKDKVLASWKSIYKYGRRCGFATSMLINNIRAVTSLAQQSNLTAPQIPIMLPKLDVYRTIIQKGSFFLNVAKPNYFITVRKLFQVSSLACRLWTMTHVDSALKRGDQSSFCKDWQANNLPISSLEHA